MKPDIVFFGEDLPQRFHTLQLPDFAKCDLLIVMGTSLEVSSYIAFCMSSIDFPVSRFPPSPFLILRAYIPLHFKVT